MRPSHLLLLFLVLLACIDTGLYFHYRQARNRQLAAREINDITVAGLTLTDLCISTEARYTRHPAVSDPIAPFMDHPGAIEHFPTGSFWAPENIKR